MIKLLKNCCCINLAKFGISFCLVFTCLSGISNNLYAKDTVLVVNSDGNIDKYNQALEGFISTQSFSVSTVDLGKSSIKAIDLEQSIDSLSPAIIYAIGAKAYLATYKQQNRAPLLFSSAINWQRLPNDEDIYGVAIEVPLNYQLFMYNYFFPDIRKIGVLYNQQYNEEVVKQAEKISKGMGIQLVMQKMRKGENIKPLLRNLLSQVDAIWLIADPIVLASASNLSSLFEFTEQASIPVFSYEPAFKNYGPTLTISADSKTIGRQVATLAHSILQNQATGKKVQDPVGTHITLNMRQIRRLNIHLNEEALDSVTEIIE
jgi:putative ABC transport system substrate-binding protein